MKRLRDVVGALVLLCLASPLLLLIAMAVKITSSGPVIFRQERIGYRGKRYNILKIRTMFVGVYNPLDIASSSNDPRITPVGKFLRATHLDELPQLVNVLRGEMSLVGPRPQPPKVAESQLSLNGEYTLCFQVRPGITGPVQIRGRLWFLAHRKEAIDLELTYVRKGGTTSDWAILCETPRVMWKRQGI